MEKVNLGKIKKFVSHSTSQSIIENKEVSLVKDFFNILKESKYLQLENEVFDKLSLENIFENEFIASKYIDAVLKEFKSSCNKNKIYEATDKNKLNDLLSENFKLDERIDSLYNSINNIIEKTLHESYTKDYFTSYGIIINNLVKKKENIFEQNMLENNQEELLDESIIELAIEIYNNEYGKILSEDQKKVVSLVIEGSDDERNELLETVKSRLINLINNSELKNDYPEKTIKTLNKINETKYNNDTFVEDISNLLDLESKLS